MAEGRNEGGEGSCQEVRLLRVGLSGNGDVLVEPGGDAVEGPVSEVAAGVSGGEEEEDLVDQCGHGIGGNGAQRGGEVV